MNVTLTTRVTALESSLVTLAEGQARTEALLMRLIEGAPANEVQPKADAEVVTPAEPKAPRLTKAENRALAKRYAKSLAAARKAGGADGYAAKWASIKQAEMVKLGRA